MILGVVRQMLDFIDKLMPVKIITSTARFDVRAEKLRLVKEKIMRKRGFTLIELLVVIAIIALLMGILMPALNQARQLAIKLVCGSNLKGLGSACAVYAHDYDGDYPRAGAAGAIWSPNGALNSWHGGRGFEENVAFGYVKDAQGEIITEGKATITSSWYLLVKYAKVTPDSFLCKGDRDVTAFALRDYSPPRGVPPDGHPTGLQDVFDFGLGGRGRAPHNTGQQIPWPGQVVSYAYHMPYSIGEGGPSFSVSDVFGPDCAIAADRNPWLDINAGLKLGDDPVTSNSATHQGKGQNVLYKNGSLSFERHPQVGVGSDNIYTYSGLNESINQNIGDPEGIRPVDASGNIDYLSGPLAQNDSYLVLEKNFTPNR